QSQLASSEDGEIAIFANFTKFTSSFPPSSSVLSISCGWSASCILSQGGRYEGSEENSSGIDRCWQLGLVRTCPGAEAFAGVRDRSYLQPTQRSGDGGR